MKKTLVLFCAMVFCLQTNAYAEYADPLENPWIFTLEEHWPGVDPIEGNGMTAKLKVPINDTDRTIFDLWQLDIPKGTSTNLVMHPTTYDTSDYSFAKPGPTIYKTAVVVKGDVEVTSSNCRTPYTAEERDTIHLVPDTPHKFRKGDGVRVKPGYVIYMPAGVPHSMTETENGNIWYATANPAGSLTGALAERGGRVYQPD